MKKISVIAVFAALLCMVSGCDFIRSIAGRPTSDQLAAADSSEVVCDQEELCPSDTLEACCPDSLECETPCTDSLRCASCGEEMDAIDPDDVVLVHDDLLATGGTFCAGVQLVEKLGGVVAGILAMIELKGFDGRGKLAGYRVDTLIAYEGK